MNSSWKNAQKFEIDWHNNNPFIYREQLKQEVYAEKMGLDLDYPDYNLQGKKILDIGGGDCSMLLKYKSFKNSKIVEPLINKFSDWVKRRYVSNGIGISSLKGEDLEERGYDEVWIYNVLQHVENPEKVIKNAKKAGKVIRIFEWIDMPTSEGHIHTLREKHLNNLLSGIGKVEEINNKGAHGRCYYGIFPT